MESILTKYLVKETSDLRKRIDQLKKDLVQDISSLTLTQILNMKYSIEAKEEIYYKMMRDLVQSFETLGDLYLYVQATLEIWKDRHTYTIKEEIKKRLSRDSSLYPIVNNFKVLNYSFVD